MPRLPRQVRSTVAGNASIRGARAARQPYAASPAIPPRALAAVVSQAPSRAENEHAIKSNKNGNGNGNGNGNSSSNSNGNSPYRVLVSDILARSQFANKHGLAFEYEGGYKRDFYSALGYPRELSIDDYRSRYERGDIAERIIEAHPRGTWSGGADIQEDEDVNIITPFELATHTLFTRLSVWSVFYRADVLAGLGHYSVILIGAPGDFASELTKPVSPSADSITLLKCLPEDKAIIDELDKDKDSVRFGLPKYYKVDLGLESLSGKVTSKSRRSKSNPNIRVHWSRIIHIAEGTLENDLYGKPRLQSVFNRLLDLDKIIGGGSEAAWRRMDPGLQFDLDPEMKLDEEEERKLSEQIDEYIHGLRRTLQTFGTKINVLSGNVSNFGPNADAIIKFISGTKRMPLRILIGSERGELASTQDRDNWHDDIDDRRAELAVPVTRQFLDRLIEYNYLPTPDQYNIIWPKIDNTDQKTKAEIIASITKANRDQVEAGGGIVVTSNEIRDIYLGLEPLDLDISDPANDDVASLRSAFDFTDSPSDNPDWQATHRAADRHRSSLATSIESIWDNISITLDSLTSAIEQGQSNAIDLVNAALDDADEELQSVIESSLLTVMSSAARLTLKGAKSRGTFISLKDASQRSNVDKKFHSAIDITLTFDAKNPRAIDWASLQSSHLITQITGETRAAVQDLITQGVRDGIAPRKLARQVREIVGLRSDQLQAVNNLASRLARAKPGYTVYAGKTPISIPKSGASQSFIDKQTARYAQRLRNYRATLIARTETLHAANEGQRELWRQAQDIGQLPKDQLRVWLVTDDDRLRDSHEALAGATAKIDEAFEAGIEPGEEPNCRCGQGLI